MPENPSVKLKNKICQIKYSTFNGFFHKHNEKHLKNTISGVTFCL